MLIFILLSTPETGGSRITEYVYLDAYWPAASRYQQGIISSILEKGGSEWPN